MDLATTLNFVRTYFLPGISFNPKDEDVVTYLHLIKEGNQKLFKDVPLYAYDLDELENNFRDQQVDGCWYFFTKLGLKRESGNVLSTLWKVTDKAIPIYCEPSCPMAFKQYLRFLNNKQGTGWNMVRYRLALADGKMDNVAFCKITKSPHPNSAKAADCEVGKSIPSSSSTHFTSQKTSSPAYNNCVRAIGFANECMPMATEEPNPDSADDDMWDLPDVCVFPTI